MKTRKIYIDPPSKAFYENRFFTDSELNRDDCLRPYIELKEQMNEQGIELNTYDLWDKKSCPIEYYSFGMLDNLDAVAINPDVIMKGFYIFEPPIVDPSIYKNLPRLTSMFEEVYVHNTHGDGYSLEGVDSSKLKKLFWPQPFGHVLEPFWQNEDRMKKIVVINGNHKPTSRRKELYSKRIEAMVGLAEKGIVDLYGRGWERWMTRSSMWIPYWKNRKKLLSIYKGSCESKFEVLSRYDFCLCFENMIMDGYMTEKLFDCLYSGVVPLYWGAPDVDQFIPEDVYIDVRSVSGWDELAEYIQQLPQEKLQSLKFAGRKFVEGEGMKVFSQTLLYSFSDERRRNKH
jgi:hypothetical protein